MLMDTLKAHKRGQLRKMIQGRGCKLLYLSSYSPSYNPIEKAFSKIKGILREGTASNSHNLGRGDSGERSPRSRLRLPEATLSTAAATAYPINLYDGRCRRKLL